MEPLKPQKPTTRTESKNLHSSLLPILLRLGQLFSILNHLYHFSVLLPRSKQEAHFYYNRQQSNPLESPLCWFSGMCPNLERSVHQGQPDLAGGLWEGSTHGSCGDIYSSYHGIQALYLDGPPLRNPEPLSNKQETIRKTQIDVLQNL